MSTIRSYVFLTDALLYQIPRFRSCWNYLHRLNYLHQVRECLLTISMDLSKGCPFFRFACEILNSQLSDDFKKLPTFTSYYVSPLLRMNRYIGRQALNKTYPQSETLKDFASCITCLRLLIITLRMCVPYSVFTFDCNIRAMISTRDLITNFRLITSFTSIDCQPQPVPSLLWDQVGDYNCIYSYYHSV